MKRQMKYMSPLSCLFFLALSCSSDDSGQIRANKSQGDQKAQPVDKNADPNKDLNAQIPGKTGSGLFLSWSKSTSSVLTYRIYTTKGVEASSGGELLRTITKEVDKDIPLEMELTQEELAKGVGGKICMYMVATNGPLTSEPSSPICKAI